MSSKVSREIVLLIHQFLQEEKYTQTLHCLERDSGVYFNLKYFKELVMDGEWDEVEKYLSRFTKVDDNRYSVKTFFEIRKQKYLEALDKSDRGKAVEVLSNELIVFAAIDKDLYEEMAVLLTFNNFRENEKLSRYADTKTARGRMFVEIKKLINANPLLSDKLQFPRLMNARLRTLINQSLNWQHQHCRNPRPIPDIRTLFVDHNCGPSNHAQASYQPLQPAPAPGLGGWLVDDGPAFVPPALAPGLGGWLVDDGPAFVPPAPAPGLGGWLVDDGPAFVPHQAGGPVDLTATNTADSGRSRSRPFWISDEQVNHLPINTESPVGYHGENHASSSYSSDDLPQIVIANLNEGSAVRSMDFHPEQPTLLLVGTNIGDIALWEVGRRERIVFETISVWNLNACSFTLQESLANEFTASVNRVIWSREGTLFGVAYSKHIVHVYSYYGDDDLRKHLEIEAHVGSVNDIAFSRPDNQLCIITCGEDKTIKVWHAIDGSKQYTFVGHEAPVYCVCPHYRDNVQFIFSTSTDGKIKAWLYDDIGPRVDYESPGQYCTRMAYTEDGTRLFSCGTSRDGESYIVEWNESEGSFKRMYNGIGRRCFDVVQFDTTKNRFLAAGDEFVIKFWDMNDVNLMMTIDVGGALPASPCIRFNKEGTLLAVSTIENGIKILGSEEGLLRLEQAAVQAPAIGASGSATGTSAGADRSAPVTAMLGLRIGDARNLANVRPRFKDELDNSMIWKLTLIKYPCQLRCLRLRDGPLELKIIRLTYTNSGGAILALADNAKHLLWKWHRHEWNMTGKATTKMPPQLWQPALGVFMTNDTSEANLQDAVPCFALSNNESYIMSASGGEISLFNMMTFKTMTTLSTPPPAATSLAFFPKDNNIIAIGLEDASIEIYNVRSDELIAKLLGHQKRVTDLVFSDALNVLVSSGADAQICVWRTDVWEQKTAQFLQIPPGRALSPLGKTRVQFHQDQTHLLVAHETQIAIYDFSALESIIQWIPYQSSGSITDAIYSCDNELIYASFEDGSLSVFTASLRLRCQINPSAYLTYNPSVKVYPLVLAAHPTDPHQFALGLNDGGVHIIEPLESEGKWGSVPRHGSSVGTSTNPMEVD